MSTKLTEAWYGAYLLFGAPWHSKTNKKASKITPEKTRQETAEAMELEIHMLV